MSYSPTGLSDNITFRRTQEAVVTPVYRQVAGEFPSPTFQALRDIYLSDPDIYTAVNFVSNRALSRGYHIECEPTVPGHEDAEKYLTRKLENIPWGDRRNERGYGPLLRIISRECGWGGSSLVELLEPNHIDSLAQVQLSSLWKFQRDETGKLQGIWQYPQINSRALTPDRYLLFGWNTVDRNPWSFGLAHPVALAKPNAITGGTIPPLIQIKWQIEDDIRRRLHRIGGPHSIFSLKGVNEEDSRAVAEYLSNPTADDSFITDVEVGVASDVPSARMNFAAELDYMSGRIKAATGNVLAEMLTGKGFSYASAVKAGSLADELVWDLQTVIATDTQYGLLRPMLLQADDGFDPLALNPKFIFNPPEPFSEVTMDGLTHMYQAGAITLQDFVSNARKLGKLDIQDPLQGNPSLAAPSLGPTQVNPGNLVTNPLGLDPAAYANLQAVQNQASAEWWRKRSEDIAAGQSGSASGIDPAKKPKKKP